MEAHRLEPPAGAPDPVDLNGVDDGRHEDAKEHVGVDGDPFRGAPGDDSRRDAREGPLRHPVHEVVLRIFRGVRIRVGEELLLDSDNAVLGGPEGERVADEPEADLPHADIDEVF